MRAAFHPTVKIDHIRLYVPGDAEHEDIAKLLTPNNEHDKNRQSQG
jgi:hypothetical protein